MKYRKKKLRDQVDYYRSRVTNFWGPHAVALGFSQPMLDAISADLAEAETTFEEALQARERAKTATLAMHQAFERLNRRGGAMVAMIRARARAEENPELYVLGAVPPPAQPTPAGVPAVPASLAGYVDNDGHVQLEWDGSLAFSTFFTIWRRLPGEDDWNNLGAVRSRRFTDTTCEAGTPTAHYKVHAVRSAGTSEGSEILTVVFGAQKRAA
jgi:hypothetical protein